MNVDVEGFLRELENYEYGVKHIIPATFSSIEDVDGAFTDELESILYARTYLERELRLHPDRQELALHLDHLGELDCIFRAKRDIVLKIVPNFASRRRSLRKTPPRSHWWWYLDDLKEYEAWQEVVSLTSERLGLVFDVGVAARMGLQPGQAVRVRMPDEKHLVISIQP